MTSSELTEWAAYENLTGPLGSKRADIQAATVAAAIANANRSKGRRAKITDFLIPWGRRKPTAQQMLETIREANAAMGGEYVGRSDR